MALMSTASCAIANVWQVTAATVGIGRATRPKPLEKHFSMVAIAGALAPKVAQT
uniref:Uncharacterized protein n=1 Tax=Oryza sativa subsp. japonica TaxID=39947 RepID=Q6YUE3_ORYSJ|nr:hypothetical protein [Oryza sativa Japonica Group]